MKVLLTGAFKYTQEQLNIIEKLGYEIVFIQDERKKIDLDVSDIEVVVCNSLFLTNDISLFKNLKMIQLTSSGMDRVPIDYVNSNNIKIYNAKGVYSVPMAEWVVLKILEIYKDSFGFKKSQQDKDWKKNRSLLELYGKTTSIFGFGSVGEEVAKRLKCFGVKIIGVGRNAKNSKYIDEFYNIKDKEQVLSQSDVVVLTLPLNEDTKNLFNEESLSVIKDKSVIVNVSRGGIINEEALIKLTRKGKFLGVALDVFEHEPLDYNSQLWGLDNVNITPHNSFISDNIDNRLFNLIIHNLKEYIKS